MSNETRGSGRKLSSSTQSNAYFIWPPTKSPMPDEMNTSLAVVTPRTYRAIYVARTL